MPLLNAHQFKLIERSHWISGGDGMELQDAVFGEAPRRKVVPQHASLRLITVPGDDTEALPMLPSSVLEPLQAEPASLEERGEERTLVLDGATVQFSPFTPQAGTQRFSGRLIDVCHGGLGLVARSREELMQRGKLWVVSFGSGEEQLCAIAESRYVARHDRHVRVGMRFRGELTRGNVAFLARLDQFIDAQPSV